MSDSLPEEAPPTVGVVEQSGQSEAETGVQSTRDLQSEDTSPDAPVGESRARGRSDPQAGKGLVRTAPTLSEVRGRGS